MPAKAGNPLGAVRAESDGEMLDKAFVETSEYNSLTQTRDFHFIVGRRGTGKSALFGKVYEYYYEQPKTVIIKQTPEEHSVVLFRDQLIRLGSSDYKRSRQISRLAWKAHILLSIACVIARHSRLSAEKKSEYIVEYVTTKKEILKDPNCYNILRYCFNKKSPDDNILEVIPRLFSLKELESAIRDTLSNTKFKAIMMYDGLDEGWLPDPTSTAIIGGLAIAVADIADANIGIHTMIFVRDNMFRLLASLDDDSSRHIEGSALRLHWDTQSLFSLIAKRIKIAFDLQVESDIKAWNRFAQRELTGIDGFKKCLLHTLYRPRDVLVILNSAYQIAAKHDRSNIIEDDVAQAATLSSHLRLTDLHKEYNGIFPGISSLTAVFARTQSEVSFGLAAGRIQEYTQRLEFTSANERDFAILGSGREILFTLYSVGFIGVFDTSKKSYTFCYDGTLSELGSITDTDKIMIHPCYWRALDIESGLPSEDIIGQINDEYERRRNDSEITGVTDIKTKRIGTIMGELSQISLGTEGQNAFTKWLLTAVQILFAGRLARAAIVGSSGTGQSPCIVADILATTGFWKNLSRHFDIKQVSISVINFEYFKLEDLAATYPFPQNNLESPRFTLLVLRAQQEMLSEAEINLLKNQRLVDARSILPLSSSILTKAIRKLRNPDREDYMEDYLKRKIEHLHKKIYGEKRWSF